MTEQMHRLHRFVLDEDGQIDVWQMDYGYHNGPRCVVCEETFCEHCHRGVYTEECPGDEDAIAGEVVVMELTAKSAES